MVAFCNEEGSVPSKLLLLSERLKSFVMPLKRSGTVPLYFELCKNSCCMFVALRNVNGMAPPSGLLYVAKKYSCGVASNISGKGPCKLGILCKMSDCSCVKARQFDGIDPAREVFEISRFVRDTGLFNEAGMAPLKEVEPTSM